jgi:Na+-driven multidrug efflux pump
MNAFHLTVVILAIGIMVVACLSGICSLFLGKRDE